MKNIFRPISDLLYHSGSKDTNLMSVPFCKGRSVAPTRCGCGLSSACIVSARPIMRKVHFFLLKVTALFQKTSLQNTPAHKHYSCSGPAEPGGPGVPWPPQIFPDSIWWGLTKHSSRSRSLSAGPPTFLYLRSALYLQHKSQEPIHVPTDRRRTAS